MSRPPPVVSNTQPGSGSYKTSYQAAVPYVNNMYIANGTNGYQLNPITSAEHMIQKAMNVIDFKQDVVNDVLDPHQQNVMSPNTQNNIMTTQQIAMHNAAIQNIAMQNAMAMQTGMVPMQTGIIPMQYPDPSFFQTPMPTPTPTVSSESKSKPERTENHETSNCNSTYSNPYYATKEFKRQSKSSIASNSANAKSSHKDKTRDTSSFTESNELRSTFPRTKDYKSTDLTRDIIHRRMVSDIVSSALRESEKSSGRTRRK